MRRRWLNSQLGIRMTYDVLTPVLDCLQQEYVLVQAWKKTSNYIRYHNWYSDTLRLDWATANLREFIDEIRSSLVSPENWESHPIRVVPAPKSQQWRVSQNTKYWRPAKTYNEEVPLRPLAHVSLRDQVVATAIMLCVADRVETQQGDPSNSIRDPKRRGRIISYGNRLFCNDQINGRLYHRWGSTKLYRRYFEDYRSFVSRPALVAESIEREDKQRIFVVESDLSKFYDRVRPKHLHDALRTFQRQDSERQFFDFVEKVFDWGWHPDDNSYIDWYASIEQIDDFQRVGLPQGLVSAGFFANVVLLSFDNELRKLIGEEIMTGVRLEDACRYVDDFRFVVSTEFEAEECQESVEEWLKELLKAKTAGLELSENKTKAAEVGGSERPLVRQSSRMERIQSAISPGFDAIEGEAILDAIQGLMRSQQALSRAPLDSGWAFAPVPDVKEDTVARFSANRYRTAYRSIRPLLEEKNLTDVIHSPTSASEYTPGEAFLLSKQDLDMEAKAFAFGLIQRWVEDPSNVRLLRIGLDIWPDHEILRGILDLLRPLVSNINRQEHPRRVAWYCLAEVLRAGATETGLVEDEEQLPKDIDILKYRELLRDEATRLIKMSAGTIPWYLRQQALLFLAIFDPTAVPYAKLAEESEIVDYLKLFQFLQGESSSLSSTEFAILAVIARRAVSNPEKAARLTSWLLKADRKNEIAIRDPSFALELSQFDSRFYEDLSPRVQEDLSFQASSKGDLQTLTDIVFEGGPKGPLRNELALLQFASRFLEGLRKETAPNFAPITPNQVEVKLKSVSEADRVSRVKVCKSQINSEGSIYAPPEWCDENEIWRFQLGFLLRFILSGRPDFTISVRRESWKENGSVYRQVRSHWFQRIYGFYNGQEAFGDDWLPISDWMESLLLALLRWPGCLMPTGFEWVNISIDRAQERIDERIQFLSGKRGRATGTIMMPIIAEWPARDNHRYSLRACIVQTVVPNEINRADITFSNPEIRRSHQNHLSAALAAVRQMLKLRATHSKDNGFLDWLILPELAVHPQDVQRHLVPFARAHRTMILAGLTYEELFQKEPLVNSALWIIPKWSRDHGWQFQTRRQGKRFRAPNERAFSLQGFRPCQWLVGYRRSKSPHRPLWMTASVCYDATDLSLVADLRNESDVYAIPSFNKDVKTFDQMALALHYHMFQLVIVANNGLYGGSNAYWPLRHEFNKQQGEHNRQIFHLHGQPQASIAFFELSEEEIEDLLNRGNSENSHHTPLAFKAPPAGWKPSN